MLAALLLSVTLTVPHFSWDACPFECCTYGRWTATRDVTVYTRRSTSAPKAFTIPRGTKIVAVTGVVVTTKAGRVRTLRALTLGEGRKRVDVPAGEMISILHYLGEGYYSFWYRGETYADGRLVEPTASGPKVFGGAAVELLAAPEWEWWVKVKRRNGRVGWVVGNAGFDGADACG
jgi:hypothetical protein